MAPRLVSSASLFFGIDDELDVFREGRSQNLTLARWAVMFVLHHHVGWGKRRVARFLQKDKAAVVRGLRRAEALRRSSEVFHAAILELEQEIFL